MLGLIIERASGKTYAEYLRENIFYQLGMKDTEFDDHDAVVKNRASSYYVGESGILYNSEYQNMQILFSIGGLYSTVEDLLKWEQSFSTEKILKQETIKEIFTPGKRDYGYGWWINKLGTHPRMYHDGGITAFSSSLQRLPDDHITVIAICNAGDDGGIRVAYDIAGLLCDVPATIRAIQPDLMKLNSEEAFKLVNNVRKSFPRFDVGEAKVIELAKYALQRGQKKQAIEIFKLNLSIYPNSSNAYYHLAMGYEAIGDKNLAIVNLKRSLEIDPENKGAAEHLKILEQAGK